HADGGISIFPLYKRLQVRFVKPTIVGYARSWHGSSRHEGTGSSEFVRWRCRELRHTVWGRGTWRWLDVARVVVPNRENVVWLRWNAVLRIGDRHDGPFNR